MKPLDSSSRDRERGSSQFLFGVRSVWRPSHRRFSAHSPRSRPAGSAGLLSRDFCLGALSFPYRFPLVDDQTFKITLFAPAGERFVKAHRAVRVLGLEKALPLALAIVVPGSAGALV